MKDKPKDGGSAFPWKHTATGESVSSLTGKKIENGTYEETYFPGMSMRQYYAGKALQAILSHEKNIIALALNKGGPEALAEDSFVMADAMLVESAHELRHPNRDLEWRREIGAVTVFKDGDQWCAVMPDFINLQESVAGFGKTVEEAMAELKSKIPQKE